MSYAKRAVPEFGMSETKTRRYYVSKTWEDFPEGGSYGTIAEAHSYEEAEELCDYEMAQFRATNAGWQGDTEDNDPTVTPEYYLEHYSDEWDTVDCFDLDEFIVRHLFHCDHSRCRQHFIDTGSRICLHAIETMEHQQKQEEAERNREFLDSIYQEERA